MSDNDQRVTVTDIDIPFGRLAAIFTKITLAAIPAMLIVSFVTMFISMWGMWGFLSLFGGKH